VTQTTSPPSAILNISCYKFVSLDDLPERRVAIRRRAVELDLRGTVLLSSEGINIFVAGAPDSVRLFVDFLRHDPLLADLAPKESFSDYQPFNRMLVKLKKEIISFGMPDVAPAVHTSPKLAAHELKRWLDEGRPLHLLDTRNDYEVAVGTFRNAIRLDIDHFREFPDAIAKLPESLREEPIVMFCTGGIRCEKAGPFMEQAGFRNVYQLDGGILKYFEEVGGAHYDGECFVFDQRVAVDPRLSETGTTQCYICQAVLTLEQQQLPQYVPGRSCPACYRSPEELHAERLSRRAEQIRRAANPLPGSSPATNRRPLNVPQRCAGLSLIDFLCELHPQIERAAWEHRIAQSLIVPAEPRRARRGRRVRPAESLPLNPARIVREGERFDQLETQQIEPEVNAAIELLFEDDELIVLNKPAPLPVHPCGRFNRNTLRHILNLAWFPERPHIVHRLDASTSGVMLLCRRKRTARLIAAQFERREVRKTYLARVHGHPTSETFSCNLPIARDVSADGLHLPAADGLEATTEFHTLARFPDGTALVRAFPLSGRTQQIRVHLWSLGLPVVGDPVWLPEFRTAPNVTPDTAAGPLQLHAESLQLQGPAGTPLAFTAPPPVWAGEWQGG
jgi:RluA family pseudouridine synthase